MKNTNSSKLVIHTLSYINQEFGKTIVMVTHNPELAEEADRLITIEDGKITEDKILRPNKELSYE